MTIPITLDAEDGAVVVVRDDELSAEPSDWPIISEAGRIAFFGGVRRNYVTLTHIDSPYTVSDTDTMIGVDTSRAAVTLTLPSAVSVGAGIDLLIKDEGGVVNVEAVTLETVANETIDGSSTLKMTTAYESVQLYSNGSNWFIAARLT